MKRIPKTKEDFAWVNWQAADIDKAVETLLTRKRETYANIKSIPAASRTFENTIYAMESTEEEEWIDSISVLMNVSPSEEVRAAAEKAIKRLQNELVDIEYDPDLYRAAKEYAGKEPGLEGAEKKLLENTMRSFKRMGFDLSEEKRDQLKVKWKKVAQLGTDFDLNINNYKDFILVDEEDLKELPENYINNLERDESGRYKVSLKYPDLIPFMRNCPNPEKRKELADKNSQKGGKNNLDLLDQILTLRKEIANLLGYDSYGDFTTEVMMAKNKGRVMQMLNDLAKDLDAANKKDLLSLVEYKQKLTENAGTKLEYFDVAYYSTKLEKELFSFDHEKVREYFPLDKVLNGMFEIFGKLFSMTFEQLHDLPVWHSEVITYQVIDADGDFIGYLLFDLFPRDNKYGHAACWPVRTGQRKTYRGDEYAVPVSVMVMNFAKSSADTPSLLSHDELRTLFHEFGHALHNVLSTSPFASMAGTSVATDFVEIPSQIQENWIWNKYSLDLLSSHYKTGQKLPTEMLDNLLSSKQFLPAFDKMVQVFNSLFDQTIHSNENHTPPNTLYREMYRSLIGLEPSPLSLFPSGFSHLIGMGSKYYSYLWALVISDDMFSVFKKRGILNSDVGKEYRDKVLAVGSSRDEMETVRDFLGREPNNEAFLEEIGLKK